MKRIILLIMMIVSSNTMPIEKSEWEFSMVEQYSNKVCFNLKGIHPDSNYGIELYANANEFTLKAVSVVDLNAYTLNHVHIEFEDMSFTIDSYSVKNSTKTVTFWTSNTYMARKIVDAALKGRSIKIYFTDYNNKVVLNAGEINGSTLYKFVSVYVRLNLQYINWVVPGSKGDV